MTEKKESHASGGKIPKQLYLIAFYPSILFSTRFEAVERRFVSLLHSGPFSSGKINAAAKIGMIIVSLVIIAAAGAKNSLIVGLESRRGLDHSVTSLSNSCSFPDRYHDEVESGAGFSEEPTSHTDAGRDERSSRP